ncbi:MAG TPA: MMPL family transporter [Myxococcota bacterium]|nr:MMPL family transporter [Myxococcota bacterium]
MAETPQHHIRETTTLRFARFVTRNRLPIALLLAATTLFFMYPIFNTVMFVRGHKLPGPMVRVNTSARAQYPDHPFINAQDKFSNIFGTSSLVAIAVTVKDGNIFTPEVLQKINDVTNALDGQSYDTHQPEREELRKQLEAKGDMSHEQVLAEMDRKFPPYPVNHDQVQSIAHGSTRVTQIQPDGSIESNVLMEEIPDDQKGAEKIREIVRQNPPLIYGRLVSLDEKAALVTAGFVTDRLNQSEIYAAVFDYVQKIKTDNDDANVTLYISGLPIGVGWIQKHAKEILFYTVGTVVMVFLLLLAYFRRLHGVLIPFIAAIITVIWGLGFTGWTHIAFDPLVLVIPMIITARAVSHTVQMAERFFEDYELLLPRYGDPDVAKVEAATVAMAEVLVPGTLGILVDVGGLLVILVTSIPQMRDLAIFGAFWVTSILATVELLHPIMICYLPAPHESEHFLPKSMIAFTRMIGNATTHPTGKWVIAAFTIAIFSTSVYITLFHSKIGEASPGTSLLWPNHPFNVATAEIARRFGGVDSFVVYLNGDRDNASTDSEPIRRMEEFGRHMQVETHVGATVSLVPFLRGTWQQLHYGDPKWQYIPDAPGSVRTMIFQLQTNGPPGFLRPFMTDNGRDANIQFFYPDHKGETITRAVEAAQEFVDENPIGDVIVRLEKNKAPKGAHFYNPQKLLDTWYYMIGPMLPARGHTLTVREKDADGKYAMLPVQQDTKPPWIEDFRTRAIADYDAAKANVKEGEIFTWPAKLGSWSDKDVNAWWESQEKGIRAVAVDTDKLIVEDLKVVARRGQGGAVKAGGLSGPKYQPTKSWTRGVQFVMAGGAMGTLAAINDEVERSHVATISLIFFVIFVLHSITYQSISSGGIIFLQIATATMLSLAYMAIRGIGLNINTLPVQAVGVGIGVDYAIYIVDRIRQEVAETADIDEAIRRAIRTTGMAVTFTATTVVGGIVLWTFSNLRFQAEMAYLLVILMIINMLGAITVVPTFYSILRPSVATALLTDEQREAMRAQKELEHKKGMVA